MRFWMHCGSLNNVNYGTANLEALGRLFAIGYATSNPKYGRGFISSEYQFRIKVVKPLSLLMHLKLPSFIYVSATGPQNLNICILGTNVHIPLEAL